MYNHYRLRFGHLLCIYCITNVKCKSKYSVTPVKISVKNVGQRNRDKRFQDSETAWNISGYGVPRHFEVAAYCKNTAN